VNSFVKSFILNNKKQVEKYHKHFKDNNWEVPIIEKDTNGKITYSKYYYVKNIKTKIDGSLKTLHEGKEPEYKIQDKITKTVLSRLKHFHSVVEADIGRNKSVDSMVKKMVDLINYHLNRVDNYINNSDSLDEKQENESSDKTLKDYQSEEITFDNTLYSDKATITDALNKLDLEQKKEQSLLELYNNAKAPLSMREAIEAEFPHVKRYVNTLKIDWDSPPKNEMLIHIKNPPEWNPDKHYFEQDKKTLQFYVNEFKKIRRGITISGVEISPWMYSHLNVFKTDIPVEVKELDGSSSSKDEIMNPPLRDNEWLIIQDSYQEAKKNDEMLFLCATRRAAKTTLIASHLQATALAKGGELVVAGGSVKDLGQIEKNFKKTMLHANPAFAFPNISTDWTKRVKLGIKKKNQKDISPCFLAVINLDGGSDNASEVLAGFTPNAFVLDEAMKSPFKAQLDGAKPSFDSPYGKRLVAILSGTGSANDNLTQDAYMMLKKPKAYGVHGMNWEALERNMTKEQITWKRREFGTYIPAQMSAKTGMIKKEIPLAEYLGIEQTKELSPIKINVTQWDKCLSIIKEDRARIATDKKSLTKEKAYYPIDPEEIFLSGNENPFDREAVRRYKERIIEEGNIGRNVELFYNEKMQQVEMVDSNKEVSEFPFNGGFHDSPVTIFEPPLPNQPFELTVAGLDDYKQEQADSDSVGSFVLIRRDTEKVVATYHSRPDPHSRFHEQGRLLLELYNSPVFMENEDMGFKEYMDKMEITDEYILKSVEFTSDVNFDTNQKRQYGWQPTKKNKPFLFGIMFKMLTKKEEYEDKEGKIRQRYKFERLINDVRLLDEMMNYKPGGNFDGLTALMSAYGYDWYLAVTGQAPEKPLTEEEKRRKEELLEKRKNKTSQRGMFPKSRRGGKLW